MFLSFLLGTLMLIVGMTLFNIGADSSMSAMGEYVGAQITHTKKLWIILPISFLVGVMITVSEPDLQVLAGYVTSIDKTFLIWGYNNNKSQNGKGVKYCFRKPPCKKNSANLCHRYSRCH